MKRQPTEWEEIFASNTKIRGEYPTYINNSYNSTSEKKQTTQLKNGQKI